MLNYKQQETIEVVVDTDRGESKKEFIVKIPVNELLRSVTIDEDKILPDVDFKNNSWITP